MIIYERDSNRETERDTHTYGGGEREVDYKGREGVLILQIVSSLAELPIP